MFNENNLQFVKLPKRLLDMNNKELDPSSKFVFAAMKHMVYCFGEINATGTYFEKTFGVKRFTLSKSLERLESSGLIKIKHHQADGSFLRSRSVTICDDHIDYREFLSIPTVILFTPALTLKQKEFLIVAWDKLHNNVSTNINELRSYCSNFGYSKNTFDKYLAQLRGDNGDYIPIIKVDKMHDGQNSKLCAIDYRVLCGLYAEYNATIQMVAAQKSKFPEYVEPEAGDFVMLGSDIVMSSKELIRVEVDNVLSFNGLLFKVEDASGEDFILKCLSDPNSSRTVDCRCISEFFIDIELPIREYCSESLIDLGGFKVKYLHQLYNLCIRSNGVDFYNSFVSYLASRDDNYSELVK